MVNPTWYCNGSDDNEVIIQISLQLPSHSRNSSFKTFLLHKHKFSLQQNRTPLPIEAKLESSYPVFYFLISGCYKPFWMDIGRKRGGTIVYVDCS